MNKYIAELYGTFLLVLAIVGTFIMTQSLGAPSYVTLLTVALAVSLVLLSNVTVAVIVVVPLFANTSPKTTAALFDAG